MLTNSTPEIQPDSALDCASPSGMKSRYGSFMDACCILDCKPQMLRVILKTGCIFANQTTPHKKSAWTIDLAGVYLYRENMRRGALGLPPSAAWAAYAAHMQEPNPPIPPPLPSSFAMPNEHAEASLLATKHGTLKNRMGSFQAARRMLDCEPAKIRVILRTGFIYAFKGTCEFRSWWRIDLAGLYLYRDHMRRVAVGLPPTQTWAAYAAHMQALNAASPCGGYVQENAPA